MTHRHITTKYGDRCLVIRPGTRDGAPALVRRVSDGCEFEIYYWDMRQGGNNNTAFYGIERESVMRRRMTKKLREMRRELAAKTVVQIDDLGRWPWVG